MLPRWSRPFGTARPLNKPDKNEIDERRSNGLREVEKWIAIEIVDDFLEFAISFFSFRSSNFHSVERAQ